jgi:pimeloyl-ACP methyl ester carboxylesterase
MQSCGESGGALGMVLCEDQVKNTKDVISYVQTRSEIHTEKIALSGSSFGAAVAIYTGGDDLRVGAVISAGGWGNGDRKLQGQHPGKEAWQKFTNMLAAGKAYRKEHGKPMMVSRFDIVPIPPHLRQGLPSNSVMDFSVDTAQSIFDFMPEAKLAQLAPRPLLLLHAAIDSVTPTSESIEIFKLAKKPTELHQFYDVVHFVMYESGPRVEGDITQWL